MKTSYELCPECCKAPTTRPGQPCDVCVFGEEERLEQAAKDKAIDDHLQSLVTRMKELPVQARSLNNQEHQMLGYLLCEGFSILFDLTIQTSDPNIRYRLAKVLKP